MADTADLKSASFGSAGSIPAPDTSYFSFHGKRKVTKRKAVCRGTPLSCLDRAGCRPLQGLRPRTPGRFCSLPGFTFYGKRKVTKRAAFGKVIQKKIKNFSMMR